MTHCQIILLHHNSALVYSVLQQFEQSIMDSGKNFNVIQSKRKLALFISVNSEYISNDTSKIIADFISPPLVIMKSYHYGNGINSNILLSFYDYYVEFNKMDLLAFASKHFKSCKVLKTCFIQLFDEKEANGILSINEMAKTYGFLTRLYCLAFPTSHHIHLFAKHKRANVNNINEIQYKNNKKQEEKEQIHKWMKMKSMNVLSNGHNNNSNNTLKNYHVTSFTSIKILSCLILTLIKNKIPPMVGMYDLITKNRLRLNVVREIKLLINKSNNSDPSNDECIADLVNHILQIDNRQKYQSNYSIRTSYASN